MEQLRMHNGTYTVSHTDPTRNHWTVKLHTVAKGNLKGKRIFSLLTGPNNENDFTGVAFWDDAKRTAYVWKRFKAAESRCPVNGEWWPVKNSKFSPIEKKLTILINIVVDGAGDKLAYWKGDGYRFQLAGRCCVCNRTLTTPESIENGIGPVCRERIDS